MAQNELVTKIREYRELKRLAEEALNAAESIGDELKALMLAQGQQKMIVGEYKLSYSEVSRTDIDRKRLKAEQEEIFNAYSYSTTYKRFLVS